MKIAVRDIIGNWDNYCSGYLDHGVQGSGYICPIVLSVGVKRSVLTYPKSVLSELHSDPEILKGIDLFDLAEGIGPYLGQIDVITVSSFCGPSGYLWGYDLVSHDKFSKKEELIIKDINYVKRHDGRKIPVFSAEPLVEASEALFGTLNDKHFPIRPGSMVPCVLRLKVFVGPVTAFCGIGIGIPEDRENAAILFMHDVGRILARKIKKAKLDILRLLAMSVIEVGRNQDVKYKEILVDAKTGRAKKGEGMGVLSVVPFVTLAKNALPRKSKAVDLAHIKLSQWIEMVKHNFLSNLSKKTPSK